MPATQSILITGASRGIGRATVRALAGPGVRLVLAARSASALEAAAAEARAAGATALVAPGDVADEDHVRSLAALAAAATGRIDLVVHSVGAALVSPFEQIELAAWEALMRTQLTSLFLVCKHATPHMGAGGLLVNISSVAARQVFPGWAAYCAAKHGALGLLGAVREELRPRGVRVTSLLAAATDTGLWDELPGQWERARMLSPAEVAAAVATLAAYPPHVAVDELTIGHVVGRL